MAAAAAALAAGPRPTAGQVPGPDVVRVLEVVERVSGRRSLHVVESLLPDEVRMVQRALRAAGYAAPWRDGVLDPFTRGALQRFQTRRGLAVCACVSLETLVELGLSVQVAETVILEPLPEAPPEPAPEPPVAAAEMPVVVNYGSYYPYGVIYLAPFAKRRHPHAPPPFGGRPVAAGFPGALTPPAIGFGVASGRWPSVAPAPVPTSLGPFPRVTPPPNVVRGGG